jgi:hypothetical protein
MSEINSEPFKDPEHLRLDSEIRRAISRQFLRHNRALFDDALTRQGNAQRLAKASGLRFVDRFTQETNIDTPLERAITILLTPDGSQLRPSEKKPHFYIYFPYAEQGSDSDLALPTMLINWIEHVDIEGNKTMYTVTEDGIQLSMRDETAIAIGETGEARLSHLESRKLLEEVRSNRLAPMDHYPMSAY